MSHPRLSLALQDAPLPAEGRIAVFGATEATDLSDLPRERIDVITGFAPDHAALSARGYAVHVMPRADYVAAVVFLSRSKQQIRNQLSLAAQLVRAGGPIHVDGGKAEGVESVMKSLRGVVDLSAIVSKAHGKIASFPADPTQLAGWMVENLTPAEGFVTVPGVFSAEKIDEGSALLAAALPAKLPGRMADLGAGWGWLSAQTLAREGVETLELVEADHAALDCAKRNIPDPRAVFTWADVTEFKPSERYSGIVMNPPFHVGREGDPALGAAFIAKAASLLSLSGRLWMVANRHLPYEDVLALHFQQVEDLGGNGRFKLFLAQKPITKPGGKTAKTPAKIARTRR